MSTCDPKDVNLGGSWGAGQPIYSTTLGSGTSTITIDPSLITNYTSTAASSYTSVTGGGYTISGTGSYNWNTPNYDRVNITGDGITMKDGADIVVGGKSLLSAIEKIEERLGILKPNPELEDRWDALKDLRKRYMEMEKDLLEKEKVMKILKEK